MCCWLSENRYVVHKYEAGDDAIFENRKVQILQVYPVTSGLPDYRVWDEFQEAIVNEYDLSEVRESVTVI